MKYEERLHEFYEQIWIKCPKCHENALIQCKKGLTRNQFLNFHSPTIDCKNCGFHLTKHENDWTTGDKWYGPWTGSLETICKHCGNFIRHNTKPTTVKVKTTDVKCDKCDRIHIYHLDYFPCFTNGLDPYFGLEMVYCKTVKGQLLWVTNLQHCEKLISYIGAENRDDNNREKWSMITNLPKWMILSKNRESVLKTLISLKNDMIKNGVQQQA